MQRLHKKFQLRKPVAILAAALALPLGIVAATAGEAKPDPAAGQQIMQKQLAVMKPELQAKVKALSPEIKQFLAHVAAKHTIKSDTLTMAQVMQQVMADYQAMAMAVSMDDAEGAAAAARRLADHRLPRGGLLPYLPLEKVNSNDLAVLPAMEEAVEGGSLRLAEAAEKGNMAEAAGHLGAIMQGCVACHQHFRGQPGTSALLR